MKVGVKMGVWIRRWRSRQRLESFEVWVVGVCRGDSEVYELLPG